MNYVMKRGVVLSDFLYGKCDGFREHLMSRRKESSDEVVNVS